ncbi:CDP-alcohol phosphatidyltransferase family protein [Nocardioides sp. AX2bis]|uniref:CDP-alcohol phosphatidyltransferase family protein n=1 Tax=Nocardioides sp. AX2bis TaxID=2653157 RepID=UPI0012F0E66C|nr:CDP-alcohol phosphatidyltransferase family protein [Nocardioides sp. AX2bis]VXC46965.1 Phosphatidylcholine synthase [Nocardioides sp. AX2bis]
MTATHVAEEPLRLRAAGWALHAYTASGTAIAFLALAAAVGGDEVAALWWLLLALLIDGTDGMLARRLRVKEVIPNFDGARLDDVVDYITYCFAPVFLLWYGGYLPEGSLGTLVAVLPLLASSYQFCRTDAKTEDHFFLGFPSYWNVVAFYVIVLDVSSGVTSALLLACVVLVFVPIKYIYPSRTATARGLNLSLAGAWLVTYAVLLLQFPDPSVVVVALSLLYVGYYLAASVVLTLRR